jgi:hypothetical protein
MKKEDSKSIAALGTDIDLDNVLERAARSLYQLSVEEIDKYIFHLEQIRNQVWKIQSMYDNA